MYLAGGTDGDGPLSISDFWQLSLSGTLSSNLPNSTFGTWERISTGKSVNLTGQAGTVINQQVIAAGGCNTTSADDSCALQGTYVLNANTQGTATTAASCPAPRLGAALGQNLNGFSTNFASQVFLLSGMFDESLWNDGGGSQLGEVVGLPSSLSTNSNAKYCLFHRMFWTSMVAYGVGCWRQETQERRARLFRLALGKALLP